MTIINCQMVNRSFLLLNQATLHVAGQPRPFAEAVQNGDSEVARAVAEGDIRLARRLAGYAAGKPRAAYKPKPLGLTNTTA